MIYHSALIVRHPEVAKTLKALTEDYWWPNVQGFIQEYVKGCTQCQESKMNTYLNWPPLQPIPPNPLARLFSTIAIDFIVKLSVSKGYDSILTITDHDCTKAVILLLCCEEMSSLEVTKLYLEWVFLLVGLPEKIILDWDTRFISKIFREICELLEVKQNITSAYHPQTDGQSKKMNQHVETTLRIFSYFRQDNWSDLLPIIQYQLNSHVLSVTKQAPYATWMGFIPNAHQPA